jgi:hypothetical protein
MALLFNLGFIEFWQAGAGLNNGGYVMKNH